MNDTEKMRQALSKMGIPRGAEITVIKKNAASTEVFVDGEYFNTYDSVKDSFLHNNRQYLDIVKSDNPDFKVSITVANPKLWDENPSYAGSTLILPATASEIQDAFERARITDENYRIVNCYLLDNNYDEGFIEHTTVNEMNFLANRLSQMDIGNIRMFSGHILQSGIETLTSKELINFTYNLDECQIIYEANNDEQLGRFYADNDFIPELEKIPDEVWDYLDFKKIGRLRREAEKGIYTADGYFFNNASEFKEVYDGVSLPSELQKDEYIFKLLISKEPIGDEPTDKEGIWISLPAREQYFQEKKEKLGVSSFDECVLYGVQSIIPNLQHAITDVSQIDDFNRLAYGVEELQKSNQISKFKAVMEYTYCENIDEATRYIDKLDNYELYGKACTAADYGKYVLEKTDLVNMPEEMKRFFDFEEYGRELFKAGNVAITEYGVIKEINNAPVLTNDNEQGMLEVSN